MRKFSIYACTVALIPLFFGCKSGNVESTSREYAVFTVDSADVSTVNKYPAVIRGRQDIEIYPQISGRITKVCITEGERVHKGQTLFIIDQVPYQAALQTAKANLMAAEAGVSDAQLTYDGKKELYDSKVTSHFDLQKAQNALQTAKATEQQAQAQVVEASNNLSYTLVSSPCYGVTGTIPFRVGALVGPSISSPLTTVSDNSEMYVYFSLPENRMLDLIRQYGSADKAVASSPEVILYLNDGSEYEPKGKIESISGVVDQQTGSVLARSVFTNENGLLHSGGAGNVGLSDNSRTLVIPQGATYEIQDKIYVYKVIDGKAVSTMIQATPIPEQKIYKVSGGLQKGDIIVAEGVATLRDGEEIKVKNN